MLAVITDRKRGNAASGTEIQWFDADVVSAQQYYPFGMLMPRNASASLRRQYSLDGADYRFGFNGKEGDDEVKGDDNQQDYGMRIYDPRSGRFLSVDPIAREYPMLTPYQFASNTPIQAIDLDGLEAYIITFSSNSPYSARYYGTNSLNLSYQADRTRRDGRNWQYIGVPGVVDGLYSAPLRKEDAVAGARAVTGADGFTAASVKYSISPPPVISKPDAEVIASEADKATKPHKPKRAKEPSDSSSDVVVNPPPVSFTTSKILFEGNSNKVLSGWDVVWEVSETLKANLDYSVTIIANTSDDGGPGSMPAMSGSAAWAMITRNVYTDVISGRKSSKNGDLMQYRADIVKSDLIRKGIDASRINILKGAHFNKGEKGRTVEFKFQKKSD